MSSGLVLPGASRSLNPYDEYPGRSDTTSRCCRTNRDEDYTYYYHYYYDYNSYHYYYYYYYSGSVPALGWHLCTQKLPRPGWLRGAFHTFCIPGFFSPGSSGRASGAPAG